MDIWPEKKFKDIFRPIESTLTELKHGSQNGH